MQYKHPEMKDLRRGQFDGILRAVGEQKTSPKDRYREAHNNQGTGSDDMESGLYFLPLQPWRLLRTESTEEKSCLALP